MDIAGDRPSALLPGGGAAQLYVASVCQKGLAEFAPSGAKRSKSVFGRDMCVAENTSQPANVRSGRPGSPQKTSASGFCGERRRKEAHAVFTAGGNGGKRTLRRRSALPRAVFAGDGALSPARDRRKHFSTVSGGRQHTAAGRLAFIAVFLRKKQSRPYFFRKQKVRANHTARYNVMHAPVDEPM